jgi:hypothetical protein
MRALRAGVVVALLLAATPASADEPAPLPSPDPPTPVAPVAPAPVLPNTPAAVPMGPPRGAVVVALGEEAEPHARDLARLVYRKKKLRPRIDDATAQVLSGGDVPADRPELATQRSVIDALSGGSDDDIQRRLAGSLARDLGVRLVVLVRVSDGVPSARVVRMPEEKFLPVTLTPRREGERWEWADASALLDELTTAPPPGPRTKPKKPKKHKGRKAKPAPADVKEEEETNLLTSPWFWGGLGLVVTVGATVLILSQTALNDPDTVSIEGRVAP